MRLSVNNLACTRGERRIFAGVSFTLAPGEALVITGRNGAGKSSLLDILAGRLHPEAGAIRLEDAGERTLPECLHYIGHRDALKSALTALPDGTVIGFRPKVDDPDAFPTFVGVPEAHGSAVVVLDNSTVLMSADAPATAELLRARELEVLTVPVSEFEKLEGCVTCLSVRVRN